MTISLQLESSGLETLQKEAAALGMSVEQLANEIIRRHIGAGGAAARADAAAFRRAMADSVGENEELLRRLAR